MKKPQTKHEPDCTGIGKWLGWLIVAIIVGACIAAATKASGQGLGVGALISASAPPATVTQPGASPGVVAGDCSGDTTAPIVTSDGLIVSTTGTSFGSGTVGSPIRLANALNGTADALSGLPVTRRRLYLRGGTYTGRFLDIQLQGSAANPWIVQPYPGEAVVFNQMSTINPVGVITYHLNFINNASFIEFRNIEFTDKDYTPTATALSGRDDSQDAQSGANGYHGGIKVDDATNITFENCVIHDQSGSGLLVGSVNARNITIRGCLFYNIGIVGFGKHHGLYLANEGFAAGSRMIVDGNIFMNHVGYAIQAYQTATGIPVSGIYCTNNIVRVSSGETAGTKGGVIMWDDHGGSPLGQDVRFVNNVVSQLGVDQISAIQNITSALIFGNYFQLGAGRFMFRGTWSSASWRTNTVVGIHSNPVYAESAIPASAIFDFNTYKMSDATPFNNAGAQRTFAQWQSDTGDEASSTWTSVTNSGITIRYIPNRLDTNLVYFAILNEDADATVDIDLTPYWPAACGTYEIHNAGNHAGAAVSSGAWTGQSAITITMTGQTYAQPVPARNPLWVESVNFFAGIARRTRANATAAEPSFP